MIQNKKDRPLSLWSETVFVITKLLFLLKQRHAQYNSIEDINPFLNTI